MSIEAKAADTLLERGIQFSIEAPFFLRLFGKKKCKFIIKQPYLGTLIYISRYVCSWEDDIHQLQEADMQKVMAMVNKYGKQISKVAAAMILRKKWYLQAFESVFAAYLRNHLKPYQLYQLMYYGLMLSGTWDFLHTIRLASIMKMTQPRNLSQEAQGS